MMRLVLLAYDIHFEEEYEERYFISWTLEVKSYSPGPVED